MFTLNLVIGDIFERFLIGVLSGFLLEWLVSKS